MTERESRRFPTMAARRLLANAFYDLPLNAGAPGRRGLHNVRRVCIEHGALTEDNRITDHGIRALAGRMNG